MIIYPTMLKSYRIISTVKNSQSEITSNKELLENMKKEYILQILNCFIEDMKSINMSKREILDLIEDVY